MLKVYDSDYKFLMLLDSVKDIKITEKLSTGTKLLEFMVPVEDIYLNNIQEEGYIETQDYKYIIKELLMEDNGFFKVFCVPNYEDIEGLVFPTFDCYEKSIQQAYEYCLSRTTWTVNYQSTNKTQVTYQTSNVNGLEMIRLIQEDYDQELWFDTKNKVLYVYDTMGGSLGAYYSNELKLKRLEKQSSSYDYCTVLYPYGKDGLTIEDINGGKKYITNYGYSNKFIEKIWIDESYEYKEDLKKAAELYLEELSQPKCSYKVSLASIGEVGIGDKVLLVDKIKGIKQKQRVVKIVRYPNQPEKDSLELSNLQQDFTTTYLKDNKKILKDIEYIKKTLKEITTQQESSD